MMKCPHKNAEAIHAIADGKQTQWARDYNNPIEWNDFDPVWDSSPISSNDGIIWRIKPPEVAQWRKDMAKAKEDGKVVEFNDDDNGWRQSYVSIETLLSPECWWAGCEENNYRVKPDPKPDVVSERRVELFNGSFSTHAIFDNNAMSGRPNNIRFIFDGETGEPKSAEVLK